MKKILLFFLMLVLLLFLTCEDPLIFDIGDNPNNSRIRITFHDKPFEEDGRTVEKLFVSVIRADIIDSSTDEIITLLDDPFTIDILLYTTENPFLLADVSVPAGIYSQFRFILSTENTIIVDGIEYPITIPSGEQSGLKLLGPFIVEEGQALTIDLDLIPADSIIYTESGGYKLKPVIKHRSFVSESELIEE